MVLFVISITARLFRFHTIENSHLRMQHFKSLSDGPRLGATMGPQQIFKMAWTFCSYPAVWNMAARRWCACTQISGGSRIFLGGGAPTPKVSVLTYFFAEKCMKMKEFGPQGGASLASPLDPPLQMVVQCNFSRAWIPTFNKPFLFPKKFFQKDLHLLVNNE